MVKLVRSAAVCVSGVYNQDDDDDDEQSKCKGVYAIQLRIDEPLFYIRAIRVGLSRCLSDSIRFRVVYRPLAQCTVHTHRWAPTSIDVTVKDVLT